MAVSQWERNINVPTLGNAMRLARIFGASKARVMEMLEEARQEHANVPTPSTKLTQWIRRMRYKHDVSYTEMSEAVGYTGDLIKLWVKEKRQPVTEKAIRGVIWLADIFGESRVEVAALMTVTDEHRQEVLGTTGRATAIYQRGQLVEWLQDSRRALEITVVEAARRIGVHKATYGRWVRGDNCPSFENYQGIAEGYNVPAEEVLRLAGYNELGGLEPAVEIKRGRCDCEKCERAEECREAMNAGLPLLCEAISAEDIFIADWRGQIDHLLARYNGKANEKRSKLEAMYEYKVEN